MVEDICPLPGASQNCSLPLLLPMRFRWRMISSVVVLAPHREVAKALLATHKLLMYVDGVVEVELLATTHADKHMSTVLPNFALDRRWPRIKRLVTDITWVSPLFLLCFVPPH